MMFLTRMRFGLLRETPKYKPTNIEHDERQIVGGIINSWPVDDNFSVISRKRRYFGPS